MMKQDKRNIGIMVGLIILLSISFFLSPYLFGSKTDWLGQHTTFPEYFRNLFYQTGNLFPSFAMNLGSGQNIFHFSYYGLWSPIILVSYFFPFIPMRLYIIITSFMSILIAMILLYHFLKKKLGSTITFISCLLYFLACPIIFHAHRHIMFVNYMPFLILGMIGVDHYFQKRKTVCLTISVFMMILTSYYYSIGGIIALIVYGIFYWMQENSFRVGPFIKDGFHFILPIFFGVLFSSFFLLPTAYALMGGRESSQSLSLLSLIIPSFSIKEILYTSYSLGLTSIFILAIFYFIIQKKKENCFLAIIFFVLCFCPIFVYLLNGMLYVRTKVLIPFLPLAVYIIGLFLKEISKNQSFHLTFWFLIILINICMILNDSFPLFYMIDTIVMVFSILFYRKHRNKWLLYFPLICISLISCVISNMEEGYVKRNYTDRNIKELVQEIPLTDTIWRTSVQTNTLYGINQIYHKNHYSTSLYSSINNAYYSKFFMETMEKALPYRNRFILATASNLPFQILMAERYLITDCDYKPLGYEKLIMNGDICLYENKHVYPIGYGSDRIMDERTFSLLPYPMNVEALLQSIIVTDSTDKPTIIQSQLNKIPIVFERIQKGKYSQIEKNSNGYDITVQKKDTFFYSFEQPLVQKMLWIDFEIVEEPSCKVGDVSITINGITNKLTCSSWQYKNENHRFSYVIAEENLKELEITFVKGNYRIQEINAYTLDYDQVKEFADKVSPFHINLEKTKGDQIMGDIFMKQDGYFTLSIPFDKGFTIYVDGDEVDYEKVNTSFLGFPLVKGNHNIKILYEAPYFKVGKRISFLSILFYLVYLYYTKRYQK